MSVRRMLPGLSLFLIAVLMLSACGVRQRRNRETPTPPLSSTATAPAASEATQAPMASEPALAPTATAAAIGPLAFTVGRNDYVIDVDDTPRKFIVYVPASYDPHTPTPVVFMFHGSNQGGPLMFENTGWAAKADAENFLVVFPTSWAYRLIDEPGVQEKWNAANLAAVVEPGTVLKDDVKFVRAMLDALTATFSVDTGRVYASGFSNGGGFVLSRLVIEMHSVFAAFAVAGAAFGGEAALADPPTGLPASVYLVLGTQDEKVAEATGHSLPLPFLAEDIAADSLFSSLFATVAAILSLEPAYTVVYEEPAYATLTFDTSSVGADNQFIFRMVRNMGHVYPSGGNNRHGLNVADDFWTFFQQYALAAP